MGHSDPLRRARLMIWIVIVGLFASGVTIWPMAPELRLLVNLVWGDGPAAGELHEFVLRVISAIEEVGNRHPFLFYGYDWLAFAHIVLAILFAGILRDPVRNVWVIRFGLICCLLVPVLAAICVPLRGLPTVWILIDSAFAPAAALPLYIALKDVRRIETTD